MSRRTRVIIVALIVLWIALLVLGFVAQTTELFGAHDRAAALWLLGLAALGFIVIGAAGVWLVLRGLDERATKSSDGTGGAGS